jgi:hypothetical protein
VTDLGRGSLGASFLRADLHVHTYPDSAADPTPELDAYIDAALASDIGVLAITDHNSAKFVRGAMTAAEGKTLQVVPGIEISTRDGHLLALFDPAKVADLESFATQEVLKLRELASGEMRSERSLLDLVEDIDQRGGLAIPAHVDVAKGMCSHLSQGELTDLLGSSALAGLEFTSTDALETWFTDEDEDTDRLAAWKARQRNPELSDRGLARLMSSDAHSPEKVGQDRTSRTLTRLRLDDPNFAAIRNAIKLNPKARCKAEAVLPAAYPRIVRAEFEGGFLDGVAMDFTGNLNCLIGGRGSGKSTALLSIRAALGANAAPGEDADDPDRMPAKTMVTFIDKAGSERVATRELGKPPVADDGSLIRLRLADLGQDESGRLARGYRDEPEALLDFLDGFIVKHELEEAEETLLVELEENGAEVIRTAGTPEKISKLELEQAQQESSLRAAEDGRIEEIARYATLLNAQKPLLEEVDEKVAKAVSGATPVPSIDLDFLARQYDVDLSKGPAGEFVGGEDGLRVRLEKFDARRAEIAGTASAEVTSAADGVKESLAAWKEKQQGLERRLETKSKELKESGLEIQAGVVLAIAKRLRVIKTQLVELRGKRDAYAVATKTRTELLDSLHSGRQRLYETRKSKLEEIATAANKYSDELTIRVSYERHGVNDLWKRWLTGHFPLRDPRVSRVAILISPKEFAALLLENPGKLAETKEPDGSEPFSSENIEKARSWSTIFELQTMCLEDRPRIEVQRKGNPEPQSFDHLSAGQQRSVLLSLLLCAKSSEPLVLDQPEDHLDGQYIAGAVVKHLEAAKERRQVLIATHSANLTVLGDAELVIPMHVKAGHGEPYAVGAVDRPETRDQICALLEGGTQAYKKRGERYGFTFASDPPSA